MATPEKEETTREDVAFVPESPEVPEHIEKGGVSSRASQFTAQVNDDNGKPLIQTSQTGVTITIPAEEENLKSLSRGSVTDAVTWFARFWIRMIKKAAALGWRVVRR